jgi:hypothetical protein
MYAYKSIVLSIVSFGKQTKNVKGESIMDRVSVIIWRVKRIGITKCHVKNGMCDFKTKTGKKSSISINHVILITDKAITFKSCEKKTLKGSFEMIDGMLVDKAAGIRISPEIVLMENEIVEKKEKKNKKDKSEKKSKKDKSEKSEKKSKKNKKDKKNRE